MAKLDGRRMVALFWLAVTFWAHLFARLRARFSKSRPEPLRTFVDNYRADGIWLADASGRAIMPSLGECVSCRLCDPVCPSMHAENGRGFVGPSRLIMANHRLLPAVSTWIDPFLCIRCRACDDACPQNVPLDRLIGAMRTAVGREARELAPVELREMVERAVTRGHLFRDAPPAAPRRDRAGAADITYVASCACAEADVDAEAGLLARAGLDFNAAPPRCCGAFGQRALGEGPAALRDELAKARAFSIVTGDPRCLEHMKTHPLYKELDVRHVLEAAADVRASVAAGGEPEDALRVTYHDPCQLARLPGGTAFPRDAIRRAGGELVEMRDTGRAAPCCGMGGGTFTFNPELAEELGRARVRHALATGAPVLLTSSPLCRDHLARCAKLEGAALEVKNVTEFLAARAGALGSAAPAPGVASHPMPHYGSDLTETDLDVKPNGAGAATPSAGTSPATGGNP